MTVVLAQSVEIPAVEGSPTPRIATRRPFGRSLGGPLIRWSRDVLGMDPLPWQEWVLRRGLVQAEGRWASRTVGVVVARQNGKTTLATIRALGGMALWGEQVIGAAQNRDIALEAWRDAADVALECGLTSTRQVKRATGREEFWIGRARYKVVSSTRRGGRGLSADLVIMDEVREYRDWEAWAALEKTRRARASSQVWAISNEGDDGSVVLNSLGEEGRASARSGQPTDVAWFEWSAPPGTERTDPTGWQASNPALGRLITSTTIASEALHDPPEVFETEVLCRRVASLHPWLPAGTWDAVTDLVSVPNGASVVFSLDAGPELRHATIAVGWRRPDNRVHVEAVDAFSTEQGPVLARAGVRLGELAARWAPYAVTVAARSPADAAATRALEELEVPLVRLNGADSMSAANSFHEAVLARALVHPPDPMTASHIGAVSSDGVWYRRNKLVDIDAAVALAFAHHGVLHAAKPEGPPTWVAF